MPNAGIMASSVVTSSAPTSPVLTNLQLWLDANDATTFTYSSSTVVSQWRDKSGNLRHFAQGTTGQQPNRNGTQNGKPTVVYDGSDDLLFTGPSVSTATDNFSVIVACKRTGGSSTTSVVFHNGQANSNGFGLALRANSGNIGILRGAIGWDASSTADPAAACVLALQRSSGTWSLWLNGTATSLASTSSINTPAAQTDVTSSSHKFGGDVYEVLFYSAVLSTVDRQTNEAYLKAKWGTP